MQSFSNTTELNLLASMYNKIANVNGLVESLNETPKLLLSNFISSDEFTLFDKENQDKQSTQHQRKMSLIRTSESSESSNNSSSSLSPASSTSPPNDHHHHHLHQASLSRSSSISSLLNSAVSIFENHNSFGILGATPTPPASSNFDVADEVTRTTSSSDLTSSLSSSFDTNSPIAGSSPPPPPLPLVPSGLDSSVVDTNRMTPVELENFWWNMNQLIQMYMQQELLVQSALNQSSFRPQPLQRKTPNTMTGGGGGGRPMNNNFKMMMSANQSPILPQPPALIKYAGGCSNKNQYPTMKPMPQQQQQQQQQSMFANNQNNRLFGRVITNNRGFVAQRAY